MALLRIVVLAIAGLWPLASGAVQATRWTMGPTDGFPQGELATIARTGAADTLYCMDYAPTVGLTDGDALYFKSGGGTGGAVIGIGVYTHAGACPESGSCLITSATVTDPGANDSPHTVTGLSAYTLPGDGTLVRLCHCRSNTASSNYRTGIADPTKLRLLLNAFTTHAGTAAQSCSTGVPPAFTGTLTDGGLDQAIPPLVTFFVQ